LLDGYVESVEDVGRSDPEDDRGECSFVVVSRCFVPDVVWDRVFAVAEAGDCLGECECCAFGVGEVGRFAPGGDCEQSLRAGPPALLLDA
jgi:hypothetical protein